MTINAIAVDNLFSTKIPAAHRPARVAAMIAIATSAIVALPATAVEATGDLRGYFLENAAPLQNVIDDIREVVLFNVDTVLANAFNLWIARFNLVHQLQASAVLYAGSNYTTALNACVPQGMAIGGLEITVKNIEDVMSYMRKAAGLLNTPEE